MIKNKNLLIIFIFYKFIINGFGNNDSKKINENCTELTKNVAIKSSSVNFNLFFDNSVTMQGFLNNSFTEDLQK